MHVNRELMNYIPKLELEGVASLHNSEELNLAPPSLLTTEPFEDVPFKS